jgi:3-oxoacyl-[acyl-carrier-protein] synthase II
MTRRVVITGVGAVTPLGVGARQLFERWAAGESGIEEGLARCVDFDPTELLTRKEQRRNDRFAQLLIFAGEEAINQAGWSDGPPIEPERVATVVGTGIGGIQTIEDQHDVLRESGPGRISPLSIPLMMANAGPAALAMRYGLKGPAHSTVSACAAGADAIGTALRMIRSGDADAAVTGGTEAGITPLAVASFNAMGALSKTGISRPFDARRDGFVMGEGAAVLILEAAEVAEARGAKPLGELLGYGASADAFHITAPDPTGGGAARAVARALEDAEVTPDDISYVNAHGTSTPLNDRSETAALKAALGEEVARKLPISSTKSAIGHLLGAAGAVEAVATLLSLGERVAPPTLGWEERDEGLDLDYVPGSARPLENVNGRAIAISNSFGFGGHNAVLVIAA